jgi:type I restriction enzyme S subunit
MRSNYKKLGQFIQQVSVKNTDLKVDNLLGVSITKQFIPSIANTIGTDMSTYKVVKKGQFTYGAITSRNGDKISIALLEDEEAIVSTSYTVFEVIKQDELLPEYLMMWFRREEFDRYARYMSHGSTREAFGWEEMCDVELPVPSIKKQREIVKEYHTITDQIKLNEQLNKKLEDTAQSIYKEWFVNFEFPDENGKPYKSNGGEMEYCDELDMEIPTGWELQALGNLVESASKKHNFDKDELIFFNTSDILNGEFLHSNYSSIYSLPGQAKKSIKKYDILYSEIRPENKRFALVRVDSEDYVVSTKLMVLRRIENETNVYRIYHYLTSQSVINELQFSAEGRSGTFPQITYDLDITNRKVLFGNEMIETKWCNFLESYYNQKFARKDENKLLENIRVTLLSKMATIEG